MTSTTFLPRKVEETHCGKKEVFCTSLPYLRHDGDKNNCNWKAEICISQIGNQPILKLLVICGSPLYSSFIYLFLFSFLPFFLPFIHSSFLSFISNINEEHFEQLWVNEVEIQPIIKKTKPVDTRYLRIRNRGQSFIKIGLSVKMSWLLNHSAFDRLVTAGGLFLIHL